MPVDLQIIRANEFIRFGPAKLLDFEASKEALGALARACRKRAIQSALLDLRALPVPPKPVFNSNELVALVGTFREAGFTHSHRLAVLYRTDPHGGARLFSFISRMQGWRVRAFDEFEAALLWLSEGQSDSDQPTARAGEEIPIHFARRKTGLKSAGRRSAPKSQNSRKGSR